MNSPPPVTVEASPATLDDVIQDCGGYAAVARALKLKRASVWEWVNRHGRLPWTELDGRTDYSRVLAGMQQQGCLTADEIRRLGLTL